MRPTLLTLLFVFTYSFTAQNSLNISLKGQSTFLNDMNDIWGYTSSTGREFALAGTTAGVSIVEVTKKYSSIGKEDIILQSLLSSSHLKSISVVNLESKESESLVVQDAGLISSLPWK